MILYFILSNVFVKTIHEVLPDGCCRALSVAMPSPALPQSVRRPVCRLWQTNACICRRRCLRLNTSPSLAPRPYGTAVLFAWRCIGSVLPLFYLLLIILPRRCRCRIWLCRASTALFRLLSYLYCFDEFSDSSRPSLIPSSPIPQPRGAVGSCPSHWQ